MMKKMKLMEAYQKRRDVVADPSQPSLQRRWKKAGDLILGGLMMLVMTGLG